MRDSQNGNNSLAKIFTIANEPKRHPSSKQFPECDYSSPTLTEECGHHVSLIVGLTENDY
jgi:hypothetical protein